MRPLRKSLRTLRLKFYHKETQRTHEAAQSKSVAIVVRPQRKLICPYLSYMVQITQPIQKNLGDLYVFFL